MVSSIFFKEASFCCRWWSSFSFGTTTRYTRICAFCMGYPPPWEEMKFASHLSWILLDDWHMVAPGRAGKLTQKNNYTIFRLGCWIYQNGTHTNFDIAQSFAPQSSKLEKTICSRSFHWNVLAHYLDTGLCYHVILAITNLAIRRIHSCLLLAGFFRRFCECN